jgi:hypothetical protein
LLQVWRRLRTARTNLRAVLGSTLYRARELADQLEATKLDRREKEEFDSIEEVRVHWDSQSPRQLRPHEDGATPTHGNESLPLAREFRARFERAAEAAANAGMLIVNEALQQVSALSDVFDHVFGLHNSACSHRNASLALSASFVSMSMLQPRYLVKVLAMCLLSAGVFRSGQ